MITNMAETAATEIFRVSGATWQLVTVRVLPDWTFDGQNPSSGVNTLIQSKL